MLKKTITYTDYNGLERTEDFYFNLSRSELAKMEMSAEGGFSENIRKVIAEKNIAKLHELFNWIILESYGEKSADGKRFVKSKELSEAFSQTEAYDQLYMDLISNPEVAGEFMEGIMPADLVQEAKKLQEKENLLEVA